MQETQKIKILKICENPTLVIWGGIFKIAASIYIDYDELDSSQNFHSSQFSTWKRNQQEDPEKLKGSKEKRKAESPNLKTSGSEISTVN